MKYELDLWDKSRFKNAAGVDTSEFAKKVNLASLIKLDIDKVEQLPTGSNSLKIKVNKLDVCKLIPILIDLENLSDVVVNEVVKKTVYDGFIKKVNDFKTSDTSDLV